MTKEEALCIWLPIISMGIENMPELKEAFDMAVESLKEKWTPISEGLPKENETVIASTKYGVYPEAKYTKEYGWEWAYESGTDYWRELEDVEAWMPLPEPYKAEGSDT